MAPIAMDVTDQKHKEEEALSSSTEETNAVTDGTGIASTGSSNNSNSTTDAQITNSTSGLLDTSNERSMGSNERHAVAKLAMRETRAVVLLRLCLFLTLVLAGVAVFLFVYFYTRQQEQDDLDNAFIDASQKIGAAFHQVLERQLGVVASFSNSVTLAALAENSTWPFFRIQHMESQASHMLNLIKGSRTILCPIVEKEDRSDWGEFVTENIGDWAEESYAYHEPDLPPPVGDHNTSTPAAFAPAYEGQPDFTRGFSQDIFHYEKLASGKTGPVVTDGDDPSLVWWQYAPMRRSVKIAPFLNYDLATDKTFNIDLLGDMRRKVAAISGMTLYYYEGGIEDPGDGPVSVFYYPVLQSLEKNSPVVAAIAVLMPWETYLMNVLPQNLNGVIAVLRNSCDQAYTFRVDGSTSTFLGAGDLRDVSAVGEDFHEEFALSSLINDQNNSPSYLGVPLDERGCQYTLDVYASEEMKQDYITDRPKRFAQIAISIVAITSLAFLVYDRLVEFRQRLVMKEAKASGAIVASLFPAPYRARLMQAHEEAISLKQGCFGHRATANDTERDNDSDMESFDDNIIADLYENCTVLFADIAGFTAWSSTRSPWQVFTLLQTLFRAFDHVAARRNVFKVETIGDGYLAVTGLPQEQDEHAEIMVNFASDIMEAHRLVVDKLKDRLGEGTESLSLRIGLNSGKVTAGILHGQKSRFQLFGACALFTSVIYSSLITSVGDCVNTASRMESTGQSGRIQLSCSTAALLASAGKSHWYEARSNLVNVKGKGPTQTYWLLPSPRANEERATEQQQAPVC